MACCAGDVRRAPWWCAVGIVVLLAVAVDGCAPTTTIVANTTVTINEIIATPGVFYGPGTCVWTVVFPPDTFHQLTIDARLAAPGNDHLLLIDGSNATAAPFAIIYGYTTATTYQYTRGRNLTVVFFADAKIKNSTGLVGQGFSITTMPMNVSQPVVYCPASGTNVTVFVNGSGSFTEPSTYFGTAPYLAGNCGWLFVAPSPVSLLSVTLLAAEYMGAPGDSVVAYDGVDTNAPILGVMTAWQPFGYYNSRTEMTAKSSGPYLYVKFNSRTGDKTGYLGFTIRYKLLVNNGGACGKDPLIITTPYFTPLPANAGGIPPAQGFIMEPATLLIDLTSISRDAHCRWWLKFPPGSLISFIPAMLPGGGDFVDFHDGPDTSAPVILRIDENNYASHVLVDQLFTTGPNLFINYVTGDGGAIYPVQGILVFYNASVPQAQVCQAAATTVIDVGSGGSFSVPTPYNAVPQFCYALNQACGIVLQTTPGQNVRFSLQQYDFAPGDALSILDVQPTQNVSLSVITGSGGAANFISSGTQLLLRFVTGGSGSARAPCNLGFMASYQAFVPSGGQCAATSSLSGGGFISAPVPYDGLSPYSQQNCAWLLTAVGNPYLYLNVTAFQFSAGHSLLVYDGMSASAPLIGVFSVVGFNQTIYSNGSRLYVVLNASAPALDAPTGFTAQFGSVAFRPPTYPSCQPLTYMTVYDGQQIGAYINSADWYRAPPPLQTCIFVVNMTSQAVSVSIFGYDQYSPGASMTVYDGDAVAGGFTNRIQLLCDPVCRTENAPNAAISSNRTVTLVWKTGGVVDPSSVGFRAIFYGVAAPNFCSGFQNRTVSLSDSFLLGPSQYDYGQSLPNMACSFRLTAPEGTRFFLQPSSYASGHVTFTIYDGPNSTFPLFGIVNTSVTPTDIAGAGGYSTGNEVFITLTSTSAQFQGSSATIYVRPEAPVTYCDGDYFVYPSYTYVMFGLYYGSSSQQPYPANIVCTVRFRATLASFTISLTSAALPSSRFVAYDGSTLSAPVISNTTGSAGGALIIPFSGAEGILVFYAGPVAAVKPGTTGFSGSALPGGSDFCSGHKDLSIFDGWILGATPLGASYTALPALSNCTYRISLAGGTGHMGRIETLLSVGDYVRVYEDGVLIAWLTGSGGSINFKIRCSEIYVEFATDANRGALELAFVLTVGELPANNGPPAECRRSLTSGVCGSQLLNSAASVAAVLDCDTVVGLVTFDAPVSVLGNVTLPNLRYASMGIVFNANLTIASFPALFSMGYTSLSTNSRIGDILWPVMEICNYGISAWQGNVSTLSMPLVQMMQGFILSDNNFIKNISLPNMFYSSGNFYIMRNRLLTVADFHSLFVVGGQMDIETMSLLTTLSLGALKYCSSITMISLGILDMDLSKLEVIFFMVMQQNPSLVSLTAGNLRGMRSYLTLTQNTLLGVIDMPSLVGIAGPFTVTGTSVAQLIFPQLGQMGSGTFTNNLFLNALTIPRLTELNGDLVVTSSTIKTLYVPELATVGNVVLTDNQNLVDINFCSVQTMTSLSVTTCFGLPCYDLFHMFNHTGATISATPPNCDGTVTGHFGCDYNITIPVDTVNCGFDLTCIQAKINIAFSNRLISVYMPPGTYTGCSAGPVDMIGKIITLVGDDPATTMIDCMGTGRALVAETGEGAGTLIQGIGFLNGQAADGGLVYVANAAQPTIRNCAFTNGRAVSSGGALAILTGSSVLLDNCTFVDCTAYAGGAVAAVGATVSVNNVVLRDNSATNQGGAVYMSGGPRTVTPFLLRVQASGNHAARGGAVFSDGAMTITDATFTDNAATQFGGALALVPTEPVDTWVTMTAVTIDANSAPSGGGVYSFSASLQLTQVTLTSNQAGSGGGGGAFVTCNENYRFLTGITGACGVRVVASTCSVASNTAAGSGGGLYFQEIQASVNGTTFSGNSASVSGAGLYAVTSLLSVTNSLVDSNTAGESGGGIYCQPLKGSCAISTGSFIQNYAGVAGGAIFLCMSGCPGYNETTEQNVIYGVVPDLTTSNGYTFNDVGAGGYGRDTASDPVTLVWLSAPDSTAVSGRAFRNALRIQVTDAYANVITRYTSPLAIFLSMLTAGGASTSSRLTLDGATTVLAVSGIATFPTMTIVASSIADTDADYTMQARLSLVSGVAASSAVRLLPCQPGQGRLDNTTVGVICSDCPAGMSGSINTNYYCLPCQPGTFAATAVSGECSPCPEQTFAPVASTITCLPCPTGYRADAQGSVACNQEAAIIETNPIVKYAIPIGAVLAAICIIAIIIGFIVYRLARKRTLKSYYLDMDSTVRTNAMKSPLQREVEKMVLATNTTRIGGGLYADIYKAKYQEKWSAMKIIKGDMTGDTLAIREFQREIICLNRLSERPHPGLLHLFFFIQRKPACIGIEFCGGGTLKAALTGKMLLSDRVRLMTEAASAMTVLHSLNVVHLDIKTDNMLLDEDNHIKLADFGISKTLGSEAVMLPLEYVNAAGAGEGDLVMNPIFAAMGSAVPAPARPSMSDGGAGPSGISRAPSVSGASSLQQHSHTNPLAGLNSMDLGGGLDTQRDNSLRGIDTQRTDMQSKTLASGKWEDKSSQLGSQSDLMTGFGAGASFNGAFGMDEDTAFTIQYVDPARIVNDQPGDLVFLQQADIYSFAIVMWAVIGQEEPYVGLEPTVVMDQLKANPRQRPTMPVDAPKAYAKLVQDCWSPERASRPAFREVFNRLNVLLRNTFDLVLLDAYDNPDDSAYNANRGFMATEVPSEKAL